MTPADVIREMRGWEYESYTVIKKWADALEAAMRERDAEIERLQGTLDRLRIAYAELAPDDAV